MSQELDGSVELRGWRERLESGTTYSTRRLPGEILRCNGCCRRDDREKCGPHDDSIEGIPKRAIAIDQFVLPSFPSNFRD